MTSPITRLQQYHTGARGPAPAAWPGAYPQQPVYPQPGYAPPTMGQDQVASTVAALRSRIAELQQRIAAASQPAAPQWPTAPQQPAYPQWPAAPQQPAYPQWPAAPQQPAYPQWPSAQAPSGQPTVASQMQAMASDIQRAQWQADMQAAQLRNTINQTSQQVGQAVNQLAYGIQGIAQSFQGLFGRR